MGTQQNPRTLEKPLGKGSKKKKKQRRERCSKAGVGKLYEIFAENGGVEWCVLRGIFMEGKKGQTPFLSFQAKIPVG